MPHKKEKQPKLRYEKPRLRTIPLIAEEVLAINCKISNGAPGKHRDGHCGTAPCSVPGAYGS